jgi:hypothetical protein
MFLPPLRLFTFSPYTLEATTLIDVVEVPVRRHTALLFEFVGHALRHFGHRGGRNIWNIVCTPLNDLLTSMYLAISVSVLFAQGEGM